jgi:hypothetical protein
MRIEHTNLEIVPCTLGCESNAPANGCTFVGPIGGGEPPAQKGFECGRVQAIGQTRSDQSASVSGGHQTHAHPAVLERLNQLGVRQPIAHTFLYQKRVVSDYRLHMPFDLLLAPEIGTPR